MRILPILLGVSTAALASVSYAQEPDSPPQAPRSQSGADAATWCVYADQIYSRGAVIEVGERSYICVEEIDTETGAARLVWRLVT